MPPVIADPRLRQAEPPLRRPSAVPLSPRYGAAPLDGVFSAPHPSHAAPAPQYRPVQRDDAQPSSRVSRPPMPPHAAAPVRPAPNQLASAQPASTRPAHEWPESLLESIPAIPSAMFSWPGDPAAGFEQRYPPQRPAIIPEPAVRPEPGHRNTRDPADLADLAATMPRRPRRDPSPSRLAYRLHRLWLTPFIWRSVTIGLPVCVLTLALGLWLGDETRREAVTGFFAGIRADFENRPEFQVNSLTVHSESVEVAQAITQRLGLDFPVSSFHLDLDALRREAEALDAVESAALRVLSGGVLDVAVVEREPAMVWRHHGGLALVDIEGRRIARLAAREARADLPLIAGDGAPAAIAEAQQLLAAASPLRERLRGLVRVGERRWDLVLDRDQRILLPASGAVTALERMLAIDAAHDLLARDVRVVDLRDASRPTIRLSQTAVAELHRIRNQATGVQNR